MMAGSLAGTLVAEVETSPQAKREQTDKKRLWRAVHIMAPNPDGLPLLKRAIEEQLAPMGVNVLVFEVNYKFAYLSDPELRMEPGAELRRRSFPCPTLPSTQNQAYP